ncbi:hypothetical protein GCM10027321_15120 [Massilia terrae]|uniref:DUF1640 domain-containing protein n=1 Tax=Massilia terrae TaxID=1811224 RepID=A0ABT2D0Y7_9BURK|nr:hypothetical protein [Massilia terrae]MCS0659893.1 hypothetical protein [Massilia terrae]
MTDQTREENDAKLAAVEARGEVRSANLDMTMKTGFAELRIEMERLRSEMHQSIANLIKWGCALSLAIVGTTVGLLHLIGKAS